MCRQYALTYRHSRTVSQTVTALQDLLRNSTPRAVHCVRETPNGAQQARRGRLSR